MFKEFYINPFKEGIILGMLIWFITLLFFVLMGWGIFNLVDSSFLTVHTDLGEVISKRYTHPYNNINYVRSGKVVHAVKIHHPEQYLITININGLTDEININEFNYNVINLGQKVKCNYVKGRISNSLYIKEIFFKTK